MGLSNTLLTVWRKVKIKSRESDPKHVDVQWAYLHFVKPNDNYQKLYMHHDGNRYTGHSVVNFMAAIYLDILHEMELSPWSLHWILNMFWQSTLYIVGDFS